MEEMIFDWDQDKNEKLTRERGISFEMVVDAIISGNLLAIERNKKPREHQLLYILSIEDYTYVAPVVIEGNIIFIKTVYPSSKKHQQIWHRVKKLN